MATVLVPLANGCEELEAVTVIDLLRRAGITVTTAGLSPGPIRASRGIALLPDTSLDEISEKDFDMIVLPGGAVGAELLGQNEKLIAMLRDHADKNRHLAAICAAPTVLGTAGLLQDRKVTGYPGFVDQMDIPGMAYSGAAVEIDGNIITSRGPGTAMDFALQLIKTLTDKMTRDQVENGLKRH